MSNSQTTVEQIKILTKRIHNDEAIRGITGRSLKVVIGNINGSIRISSSFSLLDYYLFNTLTLSLIKYNLKHLTKKGKNAKTIEFAEQHKVI